MHNSDDKKLKKRYSWIWLLLFVAMAAAIGYRLLLVGVAPIVIADNDEMIFDDFGFALVSQKWTDEIRAASGESIKADGRFLIVVLRTSNHAILVDFKVDPARFVIDTNAGQRISISPAAQPFVDEFGTEMTSLAGGASSDRKFVFDVPKDAENLKLRVVFGGRFVEIADWFLLGDRYFKISP